MTDRPQAASHPDPAQTTALILAGGRARRLGGTDKGLVPHRGRPLIQWVMDGLRPQAATLLVNANRNQDRYRALGWPVIADPLPDYQGPLAGIAAALAVIPTPWLLTAPCDAPWLPRDLHARLARALTTQQACLAAASDGRRLQPLHALIPRSLGPSLEAYLADGGRKVETWLRQQPLAVADFGDCPEAFRNLNTAADLAQAAECHPGPNAATRGSTP
jgi:molybdenum cofactor guanylyltransferase